MRFRQTPSCLSISAHTTRPWKLRGKSLLLSANSEGLPYLGPRSCLDHQSCLKLGSRIPAPESILICWSRGVPLKYGRVRPGASTRPDRPTRTRVTLCDKVGNRSTSTYCLYTMGPDRSLIRCAGMLLHRHGHYSGCEISAGHSNDGEVTGKARRTPVDILEQFQSTVMLVIGVR